ncbi:MAG: VanW family protein [Sandaracinaceae bacterium]|nr:VanW family protein [Sandaracinaceae bacterium]
MSRSLRIALVALTMALASPLVPWGLMLASGRLAEGLRVAAEPLDPRAPASAQLEARAGRWRAADLAIEAGEILHRPTREALGADVDVEAMRAAVERHGRTGNPLVDVPALLAAAAGRVDLAWTIRTDRAAVAEFVRDLANQVDHPPRPARVSERGRLLELSADGARLEQDAAIEAILSALVAGEGVVRLPVTRIPSGVGRAPLPPRPPARVEPVLVSRYRTEYETRGGERTRAHNVALAASLLDGATVPARGRLSFNDRVGDRSVARGYRVAHVILDGEMVDGIGGGVCQVASTLHAAAFLAGLEIAEHRPHSRPSAYIPMGLDATVVWPNVDLVIANPYEVPLEVRARAEAGQLVVELWGPRRPATVEWHRQTLSTDAWSDRYVEDPTVAPGQQRVTQRPLRGFTILRERTVRDARGVRIEHHRLRYPPTDRIVRVAPGSLDPASGAPLAAAALPANPF